MSLNFKAAFAGQRNVSLSARDKQGGESGWQQRGTWTAVANQSPVVVSFTPASGSGYSQLFELTASDGNGAGDITSVNLNFFAPQKSCYIYAGNSTWFYLLSDDGRSSTSGEAGKPGRLENSSCSLDLGASSIVRQANQLKLQASLTFKTAFDGTKTVWATVYDTSGASASRNVGTWTVGGPVPGSEGLHYVPVTPCRLVDTRLPDGPFGGPYLSGGSTRQFYPTSNPACLIPANAQAYALNVTVVPRGPLSYVTLWPSGQAQPGVSTLNSFDGRIKANAAIVPAGAGGGINVFATGATHLVLDVNGYFVSAAYDSAALAFYPLAPCRLFDTRLASGPLGGPAIQAGNTRTFALTASGCGVPPGARAYSLNVTAVPRGPLGFLTVWPGGSAMPWVSTLNAPTGTVTANAAIIPAGASGEISVFVTDTADVLADINGYFAAPATGGLSLYTILPCRVADSRLSPGPLGGPVLTGQRDFPVTAGSCGLPGAAKAFSLNVTAVPAGLLSYLTAWPSGQAMPVVSTLNSFDGTVVANAAIVPTLTGWISVYVTDPAHVIIDANGYFGP